MSFSWVFKSSCKIPSPWMKRLESEAVAAAESPRLNSSLTLTKCRVWRTLNLPWQPSVEPESHCRRRQKPSRCLSGISAMHRFTMGLSFVNYSLDVDKEHMKPPPNHVCYFQMKITVFAMLWRKKNNVSLY